ncbi:MAG: hypothetical protein N2558_04495 [Patescibacteria group bacterium]|nr:hypothetical protein [Patescibacteria group bacterium]
MQSFSIKILLLVFFVALLFIVFFVSKYFSKYFVGSKASLFVESNCFSSIAKLAYDNPSQTKAVYINGEKTSEIEIAWNGENVKEYIAYIEWEDGSTFQSTKFAERPNDCARVPTLTPIQLPNSEEFSGTIAPTLIASSTKLVRNVLLTVSSTPALSPKATSSLTLSPTSSPAVTATKTPSPSPTKMITPTPTLTPTRLPTITPSPTLVATSSGQVKGDKEELPSTGVSIQSIIAIAFVGFTGLILYKKFRLI